MRVWDAFALEGVKVLHRVALALLKAPLLDSCPLDRPPAGCPHRHTLLLQVAEARLLSCADEQAMLCTLQEEQARCFDSERLFSLAFDAQGVAGRFSRAQLVVLRTKHRQLLLAKEPAPPPQPPRHVATPGALAKEAGAAAAAEACPAADSSDDEEQAPASEVAHEENFEILSHDDVARSKSRMEGAQAGRGSFFGGITLPKVSLTFARSIFE